jgi:E3 Ubiquitin ligase
VNICPLIFVLLDKFTLLACFVAAAGLYICFQGFQLLLLRHAPEHSSASTIRTASLGATEISGTASGPYTLSAPITGERCYLYQTTVWQQSKSARTQQWEMVTEQTLHLPFFLEDSTGQLLVEPLGADVDLPADFHDEYGPMSSSREGNIPPRISVFLARHGITLDRPTRVEERLIQPDTQVFIAGTLAENPGIRVRPFSPPADDSQPNRLFRGSTASTPRPEIVRLAGGPAPSSTTQMTQQAKIAAALNRAGINKPEAWDVAGVPFQREPSQGLALEENVQPEAVSGPEIPPLVLMKGPDDAPFAISGHSQPEPAPSPVGKSIAMFLGGAALTALGIYVMLLDLHLR